MADKKKILFISDHPLIPSGVGTQAKYLIEGLLETQKYKFVCIGGALKHPDYRIQKVETEKYGDDWTIIPVNGYGDKDFLRRMLMHEKPDACLIFTDPRFFTWLWDMEDELRSVCPLLYWHVWDNDPAPQFNRVFYDSTDFISALSLKTYGLLQELGYDKNKFNYIPHALPDELFKPLPEEENEKFKQSTFGPHKDKKFILFWNNRNARRKQTGDVVASFAKFADKVGRDNVALMMHTSVHDPEGQDIIAVAKRFGVDKQLIISENRVEPAQLNSFYNVVDCTINVASNEGFGLGTLESLYAGTPIIVHMTGGLQYQIGDWWEDLTDFSDQDKLTKIAKKKWTSSVGKWFGVPVFSGSRSCTGSQQIPYIYDDKVHHDDVVNALLKLYKMGRASRRELGANGREWACKNFSQKEVISSWDNVIANQINIYNNSEKINIRLTVL